MIRRWNGVKLVAMLFILLLAQFPQISAQPVLSGTEYTVYFATTRLNEGSASSPSYGGRRHLDNGTGNLEYGIAKLVRPAVFSLGRCTNWDDYKERMSQNNKLWEETRISKIEHLSAQDFQRQVSSWKGSICVFTHGYDEGFDDSLRDLATLADECQQRRSSNRVLPIVFTWPSANTATGYQVDEANAAWSAHSFGSFIDNLVSVKHSSASIDMVAHSLGNLLVTEYALHNACLSNASNSPAFRNLIMADPDIDFQTSEQNKDNYENLVSGNVRVLVSDRDGPLITSQLMHGQPRLGRPIDPPSIPARLANVSQKGFWLSLAASASQVMLSDALNNPPEVVRWLAQNPALDQEYGPKTRFIDVSEIVAGDFGHRMAWCVIASLLNNTEDLAPFSLTVVHKRPDKLTLSESGGTPRVLYRFHKVDSQRFAQH